MHRAPPPVQALATQEANRAAQNRLPPLWAIVAMVVLGFDEFVAVLYNPLWLVLLLLLFLFARTVYQVGAAQGGGCCWGDACAAQAGGCKKRGAGTWGRHLAVAWRRGPATLLHHGLRRLLHTNTHTIPCPHARLTHPLAPQEMDVEAEMQRGLLPGAIALSSKFVPALKKVTFQTMDSAKNFLADAPAAGAGGDSSEQRGAARGGGGGELRSRRQREVELSAGLGGGGGEGSGSRKND